MENYPLLCFSVCVIVLAVFVIVGVARVVVVVSVIFVVGGDDDCMLLLLYHEYFYYFSFYCYSYCFFPLSSSSSSRIFDTSNFKTIWECARESLRVPMIFVWTLVCSVSVYVCLCGCIIVFLHYFVQGLRLHEVMTT